MTMIWRRYVWIDLEDMLEMSLIEAKIDIIHSSCLKCIAAQQNNKIMQMNRMSLMSHMAFSLV